MSKNNWPFPDRPGVPLNPERDGWHWVQWPNGGAPSCQRWNQGNGRWSGWPEWRNGYMAAQYRYLGPCLTPAEVAAREAAAFRRGQEAMRERAAKAADAASLKLSVSISNEWGYTDSNAVRERYYGRKNEVDCLATAIRALPIEESPPA